MKLPARAALALAAIPAACTNTLEVDGHPSFEDFRDSTYREPGTGLYIVNGDTPVLDEAELREFYDQLYESQEYLSVHSPGGVDARWDDVRKTALTYCVSDGFGANKQAVLEAMAQAAEGGWEKAANVNFVYVPSEDAACDASNPNVVFDVRPVSEGWYYARAFFPNYGRAERNVLVDEVSFGQTRWPLPGILTHELGHALGFRHEHTRPEAGTCFEDADWRALTEYDALSVMHYPWCNGKATTLQISEKDTVGASALYGAPSAPSNGCDAATPCGTVLPGSNPPQYCRNMSSNEGLSWTGFGWITEAMAIPYCDDVSDTLSPNVGMYQCGGYTGRCVDFGGWVSWR